MLVEGPRSVFSRGVSHRTVLALVGLFALSAAPARAEEASSAPAVSGPSTTAAQPPTPRPTIKWRPLVLRSEVPPGMRPIFGSFKGTYLMIGPNVGLGLSFKGFVFGGEVSVVRQTNEFSWYGAYVDAVHDFGQGQTRLSIGPEIGWSAFGLDAGYQLVTFSGGGLAHLLSLRPLISLGYATLFGRFTKRLDASRPIGSELGLLLKYPIEL
jgi:hypothetical protein